MFGPKGLDGGHLTATARRRWRTLYPLVSSTLRRSNRYSENELSGRSDPTAVSLSESEYFNHSKYAKDVRNLFFFNIYLIFLNIYI